MPYTPIQDGTEAFGIPASPITINSVAYILDDIDVDNGAQVVQNKNPNGIPIGQVIIPQNPTLTGTLQLATASTAVPAIGGTFTLFGATWYVTQVGSAYKQAEYVKAKISAVKQIVP